MHVLDLLLLSIKNLWRHKVRTFLTVTGVAIGAAAIVIMISLGLAMDKNFMAQISAYQDLTVLRVYDYGDMGMITDKEGNASTQTEKIPLDDDAIKRFSEMEGVTVVSPIVNLNVKAVAGRYCGYVNIIGVKPEALEPLGVELSEGDMLVDGDTTSVLVGSGVWNNFYKPNPRTWQQAPDTLDLMREQLTISWDMTYGDKYQDSSSIKVKAKPIKLKAKGKVLEKGSEYDWSLVMSLEQVQKYEEEIAKWNKANNGGNGAGSGGGYMGDGAATTGGKRTYQQVVVKVSDMKYVESVYNQITDLGLQSDSPLQWVDQVKQQYAGLQQILGGIGAMALLIAAIGIANTMYMSIYERTREIGIIKVIGARLRDIHALFMVEAAWIGIFGGIVGIAFSLGAQYVLNNSSLDIMGSSTSWDGSGERLPISYIPFWLAGAAFVFSLGSSLLAGFFPALRAMRLSVMKALRQD